MISRNGNHNSYELFHWEHAYNTQGEVSIIYCYNTDVKQRGKIFNSQITIDRGLKVLIKVSTRNVLLKLGAAFGC